MTVKELTNKLAAFPQDAEIAVSVVEELEGGWISTKNADLSEVDGPVEPEDPSTEPEPDIKVVLLIATLWSEPLSDDQEPEKHPAPVLNN